MITVESEGIRYTVPAVLSLAEGRRVPVCWRPKTLDEPMNSAQILLAHVVKGKAGHGGAKLGCVWDLDPLVFRKEWHIRPEVAGIGRSPGASPAHATTGQPIFLGYLASRFSIAGRVTIVTPSDLDEIPSTFMMLRR